MRLSFRHTRDDEKDQIAYSHSIVEAVLTCPRWGITRYIQGLYFPTVQRAMALEAGSAMHDVFAAVRLWQLFRKQGFEEHFFAHGPRLFDKEYARFRQCWELASTASGHPRDELLDFAFRILNTGEFYDDPDDGIRTISNMETTTIKYVDKMLTLMDKNPIWVADEHDPTAPVGIEVPFDMMVEQWDDYNTTPIHAARYIGTIDGLIQRKDNAVRCDENKTASRLDETWRKAFDVKSQPTGYVNAAQLITGQQCTDTRIIGVKVKQTRSAEDMLIFPLERTEAQTRDWARTLFFCQELVERYKEDVLSAPQFTHSCSRYFRPCAFIDWCAAEPQDQVAILEGMVPADLSPSQRAVGIVR